MEAQTHHTNGGLNYLKKTEEIAHANKWAFINMKFKEILRNVVFGGLCAFAGLELAFLVGWTSGYHAGWFLWILSFVISMILLFKYYNTWENYWKRREDGNLTSRKKVSGRKEDRKKRRE